MEPGRDPFRIRVNLGLVVKGEVHALEALLAQIRRHIEEDGGDLSLVFSEVSADRLFIRKGERP